MKKIEQIPLPPMLRYLFYSVIVTILDTVIVWVLYRGIGMKIVTSNSIGVICGFLLHYILSSKSVFQTEFGTAGFLIYLGTFLLGLILADWLIYAGETYLFQELSQNMSFLFSKGISIVIPFFFLYYLRKNLFDLLKKTMNSR